MPHNLESSFHLTIEELLFILKFVMSSWNQDHCSVIELDIALILSFSPGIMFQDGIFIYFRDKIIITVRDHLYRTKIIDDILRNIHHKKVNLNYFPLIALTFLWWIIRSISSIIFVPYRWSPTVIITLSLEYINIPSFSGTIGSSKLPDFIKLVIDSLSCDAPGSTFLMLGTDNSVWLVRFKISYWKFFGNI